VPVASVSGFFTTLVGDYGLYAIFVLMFVDALLPAASELVMVYGGAVAAGAFAGQDVVLFGHQFATGLESYLAIALAGTIGYTLGALVGWAIGAYGGRPLLERRGRWFHLTSAKLDRAEAWFDRYGQPAVFLGRITPIVRSFISIPAGVFRLALGPYTLLTLLGSAIWCFSLAAVGWAAGSSYEHFHHAFRFVDYALAVAVVAVVGYIVLKRRSARLARRAADPAR
jgi:membrane protein DedA with SNARE-associated domain